MRLKYELIQQDGRARRGRVHMDRGVIETPVFMPVGTAATVKGMFPRDLQELGTQISLANTYHLHIQPGANIVEKAGGLHKFMATPWPLLTDSGGFQVFSLPRKEITEQGVEFEFKKGEAPIFATPEWSMEVQNSLGADIIMAFDECVPWPCTREQAEAAVGRSIRWLDRCIAAHKRTEDQALFGIVQGSVWSDLRKRSALETTSRDLLGYSIGGVSVGEGHGLMMQAVDGAEPFMPKDKPRYLMGVGLPEDIVGAVGRGIDMFDCVIPTRYGRSGTLFTRRGRIRIEHARFRSDYYPIDTTCECYACKNFSRAYIHHLFRAGELLGTMLCTIHNIAYYHQLMKELREAISLGRYNEYAAEFEQEYLVNDRKNRREALEPGWFSSFHVGYARDRFGEDGSADATSGPSQNLVSTRDGALMESEEFDYTPRGRTERSEERTRPSRDNRTAPPSKGADHRRGAGPTRDERRAPAKPDERRPGGFRTANKPGASANAPTGRSNAPSQGPRKKK